MNQQWREKSHLSLYASGFAILDSSVWMGEQDHMSFRPALALVGLVLIPFAIACSDEAKESVATSVSSVATSVASPVNAVATTDSGSASGASPTATRPARCPSSTSSPSTSATGTPAAGGSTPAAGAATVLIADSSLG